MSPHRYSVFGLQVESDLPLPELSRSAGHRPPDVEVRAAAIPEASSLAPGVHHAENASLLVVEDVGAFRVSGGREIRVDSIPGIPQENVRLFLLGSAFGILLHQRGLLPLHANAVDVEGRAVAFTGASGAGKSSIAAWFHDRGHGIIADDVCVLRFDDGGRLLAAAGIPRLRLWRDILEATGREAESFNRSYAGDDSWDKFDVPLDARAAPEAVPLAAICLLEWGEHSRIERLEGVAAIEVVMANTYRGWVLRDSDDLRRHWETATRIAQTVPIFRFTRPRGPLDEPGASLLEWLESVRRSV